MVPAPFILNMSNAIRKSMFNLEGSNDIARTIKRNKKGVHLLSCPKRTCPESNPVNVKMIEIIEMS